MKRFLSIAACAGLISITSLASSHAQAPKRPVSAADKIKIGEKYAVADLAVIKFQGAYDGKNYNVGGTVQNIGSGAYTRTRDISGAIKGRKIQLFAVTKGRRIKGRQRYVYKLLRTVAIPPLKAKEIWNVPTMTISPLTVPRQGNAVFALIITAGDRDNTNDSKRVTVSLVR